MMPGPSERKHILDSIEQFCSSYSASNPGRLIFHNINWLQKEIIMFYRACCGAKIDEQSYKKAEIALRKIYHFEKIVWRYKK